jgi:hypothetical protein
MESMIVDGITILFDIHEKAAADLLAEACIKSAPIIDATWGLKVPPKCKIYVMTSWQKFLFHSASWYGKILILFLFPLLYIRINKQWSKAAGWTLIGQPVIGIKAPSLLDLQDKELGKKLYVQELDLNRKIQGYLCHELVHACANHLKLPLWLNEGIAMYTVDKLRGEQTIKAETLNLLNDNLQKHKLLKYRELTNANVDDIVYNYVCGYWMTRYLEEKFPGFVRTQLQKRQDEREVVKHISDKLNIRPDQFWNIINHKVIEEFTA